MAYRLEIVERPAYGRAIIKISMKFYADGSVTSSVDDKFNDCASVSLIYHQLKMPRNRIVYYLYFNYFLPLFFMRQTLPHTAHPHTAHAISAM